MTTALYIGIGILAIIIIGVVIYLIKRPARSTDASLQYTTALNYLIVGDRKKALDQLRQAVRFDSHNIDAYLKIGDILRDEGMIDRAIKIHRGLTIRHDLQSGQKIDILESLIKDYQAAGKYDRAIKVADHLVEMANEEEWALEIRLKLLEAAGEWEKAVEELKQLQKLKGHKDKSLLSMYKVEAGLKLTKEGKERDGRLKFREAIKMDKNCPPAYLYLSDSYIRENRYDDALTELKKFMTQSSDRAYLAFKRIKDILFNIGMFGEIENIFRSLLEKFPESESIRLAVADIYERKGELQKAIDHCYIALEKNNQSSQAKRSLVKYLNRIGRTKESLKFAIELIENYFDGADDHFTCKKCGFETNEARWYCSSCGNWNTFIS